MSGIVAKQRRSTGVTGVMTALSYYIKIMSDESGYGRRNMH